ncbi:MAG TPA: dipicolinate synthase subunit DpsA [Bacillota bacterium]
MSSCLAETGVAVIGGDSRQVMVAEALSEEAAWVKVWGLSGVKPSSRLFYADSLEEAVMNAGVVVLPISGVDNAGKVRTNCAELQIVIDQDFFNQLEPHTLIVTGSLSAPLRSTAKRFNQQVLEFAELDEIAIPNAIPTAEGAIQLAMEHTEFTIDNSVCLILGYGRVARALVQRLLCLGARIVVAARNQKQRQEAAEIGCRAVPLSQLAVEIKGADLVFNTIPASIVTAEMINEGAEANPDLLLIDLASTPGGIDFAAAKKKGLKAFLASGLPGKVAPQTAGKILASNLPSLIKKALSKTRV